MSGLSQKKCKPCEGGVDPMSESEISTMMSNFPEWEYKNGRVVRKWDFKNHYEAMAFINAVAWVSHKENHHPYITVGYRDVLVEYWTHAINGISENDFICAAKVNEILV
ncbi:MAG: 4a-hydroxytetrahydrobiopterin dehydratase [Lentisphaeraceae bacterium]|nr:4a-hydroxytetrahydrobiopterin dehydratase [Lentisphaeraceae bacterium]